MKHMDYEAALAIASKVLQPEVGEEDDYPADIVKEQTIETRLAWIFFYQSREYLETGNDSALLTGNGPIVVIKQDGKIFRYGSYPHLKEILDLYR